MSTLGREAKLEAVIMNILTPNDEKTVKIDGGKANSENLVLDGALEH